MPREHLPVPSIKSAAMRKGSSLPYFSHQIHVTGGKYVEDKDGRFLEQLSRGFGEPVCISTGHGPCSLCRENSAA